MSNYWKLVNDVIDEADLLLEILDARMVNESRNPEIEKKVAESGKVLIYVINKCDLMEKEDMEKWKRKLKPCAFMSATKKLGTSYLRDEIMKKAPKGKFKVGVLGYPNTGKSSVINALKGRASAPTAPISGYTKSIRLVGITQRMYLIDTPGVFPYKEKDDAKHAMLSARTFGDLKDPEGAAEEIIEKFPDKLAAYFDIKKDDDPEVMLIHIAVKLRKLKKKAEPDLYSAARTLLRDWQNGKIK